MSGWSLRRLLLVCLGWLIGAPLLALVSGVISAWMIARTLQRSDSSGGFVIAFDVFPAGWPTLAALFLPPLGLVAAWLYARGRRAP